MRRAGGAWAVMVCVAAAGCTGGPFAWLRPEPAAHLRPHSPYTVGGFGNAFGNSITAETTPGVYVESVLFERPIGDRTLNREIWLADIAGLSPKCRVMLEENGLRVAVIGGNLPPEFLRLIEGEGAVSPQALTFANRTEAVLPTVGPVDACAFAVQTSVGGPRQAKSLKSATGGFLIQPERTADGRVRVHCEPQIQHGDRQDYIRPASDSTGFTIASELPLERFPTLGFDVVLGPGEYLLVGWQAADEGEPANRSLGAAMFCVEAKGEVRQRVLVVRAGYRGATPSDLPDLQRVPGARPIALQANRW